MIEEILNTNGSYTRCFPLEPYYKQSSLVTDDRQVVTLAEGTEKMASIREAFYEKVLKRCADIRASKPQFSFPPRPIKLRSHQHHGKCLIALQNIFHSHLCLVFSYLRCLWLVLRKRCRQ